MHLLVGTDFSTRSDRALRRAVILAKSLQADLTLLHVIDDDRPRRIVNHEVKDARLLLAELAGSLSVVEGISCKTNIVLDDPFAGIVNAAAKISPDLLVLGSHRRQILRDVFVGTTAERTIRNVHCPVLMVNGPPVGHWRHVLLTTDLTEQAGSALRRFAGCELGEGAVQSLLHVFDAPSLRPALSVSSDEAVQEDYLEDLRDEAQHELQKFVDRFGIGRPVRMVRHQDATVADEILKAAGEVKADLIVLTAQGKGTVARIVLGSVTLQVLKDAHIDVLVMPTDKL